MSSKNAIPEEDSPLKQIQSEYKDMIISELKAEIFELRKNHLQIDKMSNVLAKLEAKCNDYEKEKKRVDLEHESCYYGQNDLLREIKEKYNTSLQENERLKMKLKLLENKERNIKSIEKPSISGDTGINHLLRENFRLENEVNQLKEKNTELTNNILELKEENLDERNRAESMNYDLMRLSSRFEEQKSLNKELKRKIKSMKHYEISLKSKADARSDEALQRELEAEHIISKAAGITKVSVSLEEENYSLKQTIKEVERVTNSSF